MDRKNSIEDPWESWEYSTGRTKPPKSYRAMLAVLLILVIFLCGIVSALGILNIRLTKKLSETNDDPLGVAFSTEGTEATGETEPAVTGKQTPGDVTVNIHSAPGTDPETPDDGLSFREIYKQNIPSVVSVTAVGSTGAGSGSGVVLSRDGYIVTNLHVIAGARTVTVLLTDGRELTAEIVGGDEVSDLAVLRVPAEDLTAAQFGDTDNLEVGDTVVAIGDPLGVKFRGTMTDGIVSAINRDVIVKGRTMSLIQTNAALNSGNSGGPLINRYGQVIGINTIKISTFADSAGVTGIGFAIPSTTVKAVVEELIAYGYVPGRPSLGLQGESLSLFYQHFYRLPAGLVVTQVEAGGAACLAGVQTGDILVSIDGAAVTSQEELNAAVYSHEVGDVLELGIYRDGISASVQATLGEAKS